MGFALLVALAATAALLVVALCAVLAVVLRDRRRLAEALATSRTDVEALRTRVDALTEQLDTVRGASPLVPEEGYVITRVTPGSDGPGSQPSERDEEDYLDRVSNRVVLSATLGEPLVKAAAFGYAVRRALSPANRNRIAFEMRREVKRARKQRRRDARQARRAAAAAQRGRLAAEDAA